MTENTNQMNVADIPLVMEMKSLEINECRRLTDVMPSTSSGKSEENTVTRRVLRKKIQPMRQPGKRRVITKPKKCDSSNSNSDFVKNIYLCKKIKRFAQNLETIFEEPKVGKNNEEMLIGQKKFRRFIVFEQSVSNPGRIRKRKTKVKRSFKKPKKERVTMEALLDRLKYVE